MRRKGFIHHDVHEVKRDVVYYSRHFHDPRMHANLVARVMFLGVPKSYLNWTTTMTGEEPNERAVAFIVTFFVAFASW